MVTKRRVIYFVFLLGLVGICMVLWTLTSRAGYESADYTVIESDGSFEIREYPDLMLAATSSDMDSRGRDGSFMRLFRFISGANEQEQKIAMTTPVFMEGGAGESTVSMGFVMPRDVASSGVPEPNGQGVEIRQRDGGRFAVVRFAGWLSSDTAEAKELELRDWMKTQGIEGEALAEAAGYDPPFTPGPLRRNEVLVRLSDSASVDSTNIDSDGVDAAMETSP
ncbi:MAG: heme-binding protein [Planctomycetota bacterium]